jgi:hypothetical protein
MVDHNSPYVYFKGKMVGKCKVKKYIIRAQFY